MAGQQFSGFLAFLAIANLPLTAGYSRGFGGYGDSSGRVGPWDANSTNFLEAVAASNATGVYKIPGYDVSKPYPGEPMDGWRLRLALLDMSQAAYSPSLNNRDPFVGYSLTIEAPPALLKTDADDGTKVVDTDPSWGMCMWHFGHPNQLRKERYNNLDNKPLAADGSCRGFLSDACIAALEKATEDEYEIASSANATRGGHGSLATCSRMGTPDECGGGYGPGGASPVSVPADAGVPVRFLNGSVTTSDGWEFEHTVHYNSTEDLREYWDSSVLNYWVIVTAMVNATMDPDRSDRSGPGLSRVHCVAPNGEGTGKGFTFSGVVPANSLNGDGGEGESGDDAGAGNGGGDGGDGDSGAGLVSPGKWRVWLLLAVPVVLAGWV